MNTSDTFGSMPEKGESGQGEKALLEHITARNGGVEISAWKQALPTGPVSYVGYYEAAQPSPHWDFITFGASELDEKVSGDPAVSGSGYELTMRLARKEGEAAPPPWVRAFLISLVNNSFETGKSYVENDWMDLGGALDADVKTDFVGAAFVLDPLLGKVETPNGSVMFLQVVPIDAEGLKKMQGPDGDTYVKELGEKNPHYITDLEAHKV